jgi:hypothetical protein
MKLYSAIHDHDFSENTCFLCGAILTSSNRADEHVISKWVQGRYDLWDQKIALLNGTLIPYRQLTIPCCSECNTKKLSQVEDRVRSAIENGYEAVAKLDSETLFIWLGKMFYGMLYRELFLTMDRSSTDSVQIVSQDDMETFQMHHYFIQCCRVPMEFVCSDGEFPWTIYVFQLQELDDRRAGWDFRDDINNRTLFVRLGSVGMLAAFDCGAISVDAGNTFSQFSKYLLHPLQFEELGARFFYMASRLNRSPKIIIGESDSKLKVMLMPMAGLSMEPVFNKWEPKNYVQFLSYFTQGPVEQIHPSDGSIMTWLRQQDSDEFMHLDIKKTPYR